ncbi:MAG: ABC transporter permease [Thermoflexales bacterium]
MLPRPTYRLNVPLTAATLVLLLTAWEIGVYFTRTPMYLLPPPSAVLGVLCEHTALYTTAAAITFAEALGGLALGSAAAILLALTVALLPWLQGGVMSLAIVLKSMPLAAIAPLLTIWLGFGWEPKVIITALLTFFPTLVNVTVGLQTVEPARLEHMASWNATPLQVLWHLRLPHSLPYVFAALKVAAPLSLIGAVVAEWAGASGGLGRIMWLAYANLNLPFMFAAIFILAAAGITIYGMLTAIERRVVFWL